MLNFRGQIRQGDAKMRRGSFRRGSMYRLGGLVNQSMDALGLQHKILQYQAVDKWASVVGSHIAAATVADGVREGVLFICCKSSAWCNELSLHKGDILKRLNAAVGKKVITDIRFSARGYRKAISQNKAENPYARIKGLDRVQIDEKEIEVAKQVASVSPSEELASRIQKAILTSKRLKELKIQEGWKQCPKCKELHNGKNELCDNCSE